MNLRQLEIFAAVMREGTTVAAANRLNMSQPAVSNAIMQLEASLEVTLFHRLKGRLHPSQEAEMLFRKSLDVFASFEAAQMTAARLKDKTIGHLRVAATPSLGSTLLRLAMHDFRRARPDVKVSVMIGGVEEVQGWVASEKVQAGFYYTDVEHPLLVSEPIAEFDLVCALPRGHPLTATTCVDARDLVGESLVSYVSEEVLGMLVARSFGAVGLVPESAIEVRFVHTACEFVANGDGVAIVDRLIGLRPEFVGRIAFRPFRPAITVPIRACTHREAGPAAIRSLFLQTFAATVRRSIDQGGLRARMADQVPCFAMGNAAARAPHL